MAEELYAVVLTFSQEFSDAVSKLRENYQKYMGYAIVPHITLVYPFRPTVDINAVNEKLEEVAKSTKPFTLILHGIEYFEKGNNVAYVAVEDKWPVINLHANIFHSLKGLIKEDIIFQNYNLERFTPHVTIGERIPDEIFPTVKEKFSDYEINYECEIMEFSLFSDNGVGRWEVARVFELAG